MQPHKVRLAMVVALMSAMGGAEARAEKKYSIVDLGTGVFTKLNNRGQAIGVAPPGEWDAPGIYYDGETTRELGAGFMPLDLNDRGQIVGNRWDPEAPWETELVLREADGTERVLGEGGGDVALNNRGQVLSSREETTIYSPWGTEVLRPGPGDPGFMRGTAINDAGTVVGFALDGGGDGGPPVFEWYVKEEGGPLRWPGGGPTGADAIVSVTAINNAGQVIGVDGGLDAFLFTPGDEGYVELPFTGGQRPALNDLGQVVGSIVSSDWWGATYPALYDGGQVIDLRELLFPYTAWTLEWISDLNNQGQILGRGYGPDGMLHSILLTPQAVPEPGTLAMGLVLAGAGVVAHRRRARMRQAAGGS